MRPHYQVTEGMRSVYRTRTAMLVRRARMLGLPAPTMTKKTKAAYQMVKAAQFFELYGTRTGRIVMPPIPQDIPRAELAARMEVHDCVVITNYAELEMRVLSMMKSDPTTAVLKGRCAADYAFHLLPSGEPDYE